jgi:hypothetical protein
VLKVAESENMTSGERRMILIKPGDTLLIGNLGDLEPETCDMAMHAFRSLGLDRVVLFVQDIDIDLARATHKERS